MKLHELFMPTEEDIEQNDEYDMDYWEDKDEVTLVSVTLIPGGEVDHATLVYYNGKWEVELYYGYRVNYDVEIHEGQAKEILQEVFGRDLESVDFHSHDHVYVE